MDAQRGMPTLSRKAGPCRARAGRRRWRVTDGGEHPKVVAELLGHAKVTLTLDTYSHVSPALLDQAAQRMESIIAEAPAVTLRR